MRPYEHLTHSVLTGGDGVRPAFGKAAFELLSERQDEAQTFQHAMSNLSAIEAAAVLEAYDFSGIASLCDVGGGHGTLLGAILRRHAGVGGVLFDLPHVVAGAQESRDLDGLLDRVKIEPGSFFERVPAGCDAYILKHVLHDWSDDHCRTVLGHIRQALPPHGRVLICEMVIDGGSGPSPAKFLDIEMLAITEGGPERTASEFKELLASAGLNLKRIIATRAPVCVIEAGPV